MKNIQKHKAYSYVKRELKKIIVNSISDFEVKYRLNQLTGLERRDTELIDTLINELYGKVKDILFDEQNKEVEYSSIEYGIKKLRLVIELLNLNEFIRKEYYKHEVVHEIVVKWEDGFTAEQCKMKALKVYNEKVIGSYSTFSTALIYEGGKERIIKSWYALGMYEYKGSIGVKIKYN